MTSKLCQEKKFQENCQFMFQIYALNQKVHRRVAMCYTLETF